MRETSSILSPEHRRDLDSLLNTVLPLAQKTLSKQGEFYPFGASTDLEGQVALEAAYDGNEHPEPGTLIKMLVEAFRGKVADLRAVAICLDARVVPPGATAKVDAIETILEHSCKVRVDVFLPYRKGLLGRHKFGQMFASHGECQVFE